MPAARKILVVTPLMPFPLAGACQADRAGGIQQLVRLGYEVRVLTMVAEWQKGDIEGFREHVGIPVQAVEYAGTWKERSWRRKAERLMSALRNPALFDGAAYAYALPHVRQAVGNALGEFEPDLLWCDYTYLWPLHDLAAIRGIPVVTRSINFEPLHFLQEDGFAPANLMKFIPKLASELLAARKSALLFPITPKEERAYRALGARRCRILPLRGLPDLLDRPARRAAGTPLRAAFMAGSYSVPHNRRAAEFLVREVAPRVERLAPGDFVFHVTGKKAPENLRSAAPENVVFEGFVEDLDTFLSGMDLAVAPSLYGAGMQQKIFEPLVRKLPLVTSPRGLAGYPFRHGEHLLLARSPDEFAERVVELRDAAARSRLAENAYSLSLRLFSREASDAAVREELEAVMASAI